VTLPSPFNSKEVVTENRSEHGEGGPSFPVLRLPGSIVEIAAGVLFCCVAAMLWVGAHYISARTRGLMGPVAFPKGVAILLGGCSLVMIARAALRLRSRGRDAAITFERPNSVFAAMALVIVYPLLIEKFGYYPATGVWLLPFLWSAGCRNPLVMLCCSVGFLIFTKIVFEMVLGTPMP